MRRGQKEGTNPYCPPVFAMPSDDAQLVIEIDEELPAGSGKKMGDKIIWDTVSGGDSYEGSHKNSIDEVPELY